MAFQGFLRQSTAVDVLLGPFLDEDDGKTAETGLTISASDVRLSKNGQNMAAKNDATACVHDEAGNYNCELDATDTNTVGQLTISVDESGALPVRLDYHVVEEAVYDAMYGGSAAGPLQSTTAARKLDVTATGAAGIDWGNIENQGTTVDLSATDINLCDTVTNTGTVTGNVNGSVASVTGAVGSVTGNVGGNVTGSVGSVTGNVGGNVAGSVDSVTDPVTVGTNIDKSGYSLAADQSGVTIGTVTDVTNGVDLADDAITSAKYDESTAFPLAKADSGTTILAREEDGSATYTLKTLSSQIGGISGGGSAISKNADSYTLTTGTQTTGTFSDTNNIDGVYHGITNAAGTIDYYYTMNIGTTSTPVEVSVNGRLDEGSPPSGGDTVDIVAYNNDTTSFEVVRVDAFTGINGSTSADDTTEQATLFSRHVDANGDVKVGIQGSSLEAGTEMLIDQITVSYTQTGSTTGYQNGAIWVDTNNGESGSIKDVNGVADRKVDNWADALAINAQLGFDKFIISNDSTIQLTGDSTHYTLIGDGLFNLDMNGQVVQHAKFYNASVSGEGTGNSVIFEDCQINAGVSLPPSYCARCGFLGTSGSPVTAGEDGEFLFTECVSIVAGSGTPYFDFSGTGATTGINNRNWSGGIHCTLDDDCVMSQETHNGGGHTFITGGADLEIRGRFRECTLTLSGAGTVQSIASTGKYTISGTATTTVNIFGDSSQDVIDTSSGTTVNKYEISRQNWLGGDYSLDTDANGRIRIVDGTGAGELDTTSGKIDVNDKTGFSINGTITTLDALDTALDSAHGAGSWETATGFSTFDHTTDQVIVGTNNDKSDYNLAADQSSVTIGTVTTNTDMRGTDGANTVVPMDAATSISEHNTTQSAIGGLNDVAATDIVSNGPIDTLSGAVVNVDLVDVTTTNTDMVAEAPTVGEIDTELTTSHGTGSWQTGTSGGGGGGTVWTTRTYYDGSASEAFLEGNQNANINVTLADLKNQNDDPINLLGKDLSFEIWQEGTPGTVLVNLKNYDGDTDITVSGADSNTVAIYGGKAQMTMDPGQYLYRLRNDTDDEIVVKRNEFKVNEASA